MYFLGIFLGLSGSKLAARRQWIGIAFLGVAFAMTLNAWTLSPDHGPEQPAPEMAYIKLEGHYRHAAGVLEDRLKPEDTLAAGDIGVLGYETNARIIDTVGLISPSSARYYPLAAEKYVINYAIPNELIFEAEPDYIVVLEIYIRETLLKEPAFHEQYEMLTELETDIYGSNGMLIFKKR